ncbi:hypothetical protein LTR62_003292 [Meristemomyces frigidus]|uniref:isoleucine--tRNA ligase n=1 Tax=Meristemomyces frigidus TaxID=1508187 RepID=A0AAN7TIX1_9PEZI|nr:hypothetical protein LTR62_003292 [Meristemomyces frigidus]
MADEPRQTSEHELEQMPALRPAPILRLAADHLKQYDWPKTLNLPKSAFPARAAPADLARHRQKCANDLYTWQRTHRPVQDEFVLHDGPPYANGPVHVGHALNKVLKDLILRTELARGRRIHYRPGWDCHGLPIELKALQQAQTQQDETRSHRDVPPKEARAANGAGMSADEIRLRARELATATIEIQRSSFREWGVMGEWDAPYRTMDQDFEIRQLGVFREMVKKGLISRHHRPVYWSPSSGTALAEAELEYDDHHQCTAAFVKMPFVRLPNVLKDRDFMSTGKGSHRFSALIWTTTPWTLPSNQAIALGHDIRYSVIQAQAGQDKEYLLVASDRIEHVTSFLPIGATISAVEGLEDWPGSDLADGHATCLNVFQDQESPLLIAQFVTASSGTGVVHMAPGHGMDDYLVCQQNNVLTALAPVDGQGRYTAEVFPASSTHNKKLTGLDVQTAGVDAVLDVLSNAEKSWIQRKDVTPGNHIFATHAFTHKNPIDWRTKQPVITRATAQWFADTSALKGPAIESLEQVDFLPTSGKNRLISFLAGRSQWCISRQRAWGVPIPALYHAESGEACITDESIAHIIEMFHIRGTDAWFENAEDDPAWVHQSLEPGKWLRGKDTMDVWFDSGTTWTSLEPRSDDKAISDVYVEGTDQHRGWFQSSLLTHVATQDPQAKPKAPYAKLITHGFTLDAEGRKMSKSIGNVISPEEIMGASLLPPLKEKKQRSKHPTSANGKATGDTPKYDAMGPDALRLWVASSDYTRDVTIAIPLLQDVHNTLQKYRVTFKWLLGVLEDYSPSQSVGDNINDKPSFADEAVLHRLREIEAQVFEACSNYAFHRAVKEITNFVNNDLSAFYFEVCKDTLYTGLAADRRRTQAVLEEVLQRLMLVLAPATPHLIEEVWEYMPAALKQNTVHPMQRVWELNQKEGSSQQDADSTDLRSRLGTFRDLSMQVKFAQEEARRAGKMKSGLACSVEIHIPENTHSKPADHIREWAQRGELADLLVVSQAIIVEVGSTPKLNGNVAPAWRFEQVLMDWHQVDQRINVVVLPPTGAKCVRCWKYTAEEEGVSCEHCRNVLKEKGAP